MGGDAAERTQRTRAFYDSYWPANVPERSRTREHVLSLLPPGRFDRVLDAGCGTGVCSLALSERAGEVVGVDISRGSLRTAWSLAADVATGGIRLSQASLLNLPLPDAAFDLVFSWGVIHHTVNPIHALDELVRVLKPGGALILAVYLKTPLTSAHEALRWTCLRLPAPLLKPFVRSLAVAVRVWDRVSPPALPREDSGIEALIEDWYFVPVKHFFGIEEMGRLFAARGLSFELVHAGTGRFKSTSNFICCGCKQVSPRPEAA